MSNYTKYNPLIAWRTIASSVRQLTREDENNPSTYRITVTVIDTNDIGQGQKDTTCFFTDNSGIPYKIIAIDTNTIDVIDIFKTGLCPVGGKEGWVHKSAYKGYSHALPANLFWNLHKLAPQNNYKYAMSVLWANDPNGRRVPFTDIMMPSIPDYRGELIDEDGVTFKPEEDYGQNPQFECWQLTEAGKYSRLPIDPQITRSLTDGLIDSVLFSGTGEEITGYILIKN